MWYSAYIQCSINLCILLQISRCEVYIGGSLGVESVQQKEEQAFVARVNTAKSVTGTCCVHIFSFLISYCRALGTLAAKLSTHPTSTSDPPQQSSSSPLNQSPALTTLCEGLRQMLVRCSSTHRMVASLVVGYWGQCPSDLHTLLSAVLNEKTTYEEITPFLVAMQRECHVRLLEINM